MNNIFSTLWNKSFRTQLIYGFGLILTILIITFTYMVTKYQSDFLHEEALKQAENRSLALATTSKTWIMANDYVGLEEVVDNFSIYDDLVFTAIINMDGKIIAHSNRALVGKYIADSRRVSFLEEALKPTQIHSYENKILLENEQYIDIIRVIHQGNLHIGLVHIRLDQEHRQATIRSTVYQGILFTILSIIIGIVFAYYVADGLIKQLLKLITTMKGLRGGNKDIKADESGVEEISELSHEFNDLIETLHSSEELNEQLTERLELAFTGTKDGLWDWDIKNDTVYFSPLWKSMLGYADNELSNELSSWEDRVHPEDLQKTLSDLQEHIDGKTQLYINIHRLKHKDGFWIWTLDRGKALFDENGTAVRMVGTHTDITEHKKIEQELRDKKQNFQAIYEGSKEAIAILDEKSNFLQVNSAYIEMTGMSEEELLATSCIALSAPEDIERSIKAVGIVLEYGFIKNYEKRCRVKSGDYINVNMSISRLDNPTRILTSVRDVTKQKEAQRELSTQYKLLQNIVDTVPSRIFWKNKNLTYLGANKLFLKDAEVDSVDELIGKSDFDLPWGKTEAEIYRANDLEVMENGIGKSNFEEIQTDEDGHVTILLTSKVPLRDADDEVIGVLGSYADITAQRDIEEELKKQKDVLAHQAHHDALTGLPNRVLFNDRLSQAIEKAKRSKTKVALLFIDLDHFKEINDSLGHETGDEILKEVTQRLKSTIRDEDTLARLGGDEFTVIIEELIHGEDASLLAQKILNALAKPININENILYVSSSIGISLYPDDGSSSANLLKYADSAMYKAKDEGRNNFQFYSAEMTELAFERVVMETSLREALEHEDFLVYYQPQVDALEDKITGMEALVRWRHNTMGIVSPAKFIPIAESTGLIVELDRFVMKTAMTQFSKWYDEGLSPGVLAMNLSIKQLQRKDFITVFENLIKETGCRAEWLELEVTEGQIMSNPEESIKILNQINDIGIELAIDDFGTGYSSLSYLKKLPINKLKIDQSFVKGLPDGEEDAAIAKAVIVLAESLNLRIIAEGVETQGQKEFLVSNGCKNIQGYFYAKPMPADELEKVLIEGLTS